MARLPKFYITTAIYYVNDVPHLGHTLEVIGADVQARYRRMIGHEVMFLTGTDEHGQKVAEMAAKNGVEPQAWTDRLAAQYREVFNLLEISFDDFIRTTENRHTRSVQTLWQKLEACGDIYLGKYEGWYDVKEESYITEKEMEAQSLKPDGVRIKRMVEDAYFFRLSKYKDALIKLYEQEPDRAAPEWRRNEVLNSFLKQDMPDLCISRTTITWGIPVPSKPGHVVYVWFDALINYLTGAGYGWDEEKFAKLWPADVHVIGKDILKFHCVWWPAFLMAAGIPVARQVFAHGFINVLRPGSEGAEKMSKSAGNVVNPVDYVKKIGAEPLRYLLMREVNYGTDGVFNEESLVERYNAELPNGIGNTLSRVATLIAKNFDGGEITPIRESQMTDIEREFVSEWRATVEEYERTMPRFEYQAALQKVYDFMALLNRRINEVEPWRLAKDPAQKERLRVFLTCVAEGIRGVAVLLKPVMPEMSQKMLEVFGLSPDIPWEIARQWGKSYERTTVTKPQPLFQKLES